MTAYSFQSMFVAEVSSGVKCQTVRGHRKRHASVGERVQLYTGMRTKACRKLVDPDPIVTSVDKIWMQISNHHGGMIESISINGVPLRRSEIEAFAIADGFGGFAMSARNAMGIWFAANHNSNSFHGVVIKWERRP